jgi:hypothetical protein
MKKCIFLFISCFIVVFMSVSTGICQNAVPNSDFECENPGCGGVFWTQCGSGSSETGKAETSYGGSISTNNVGEVDNEPVALCQTISGFISGEKYDVSLDLSRRISSFAPTTVGVKVCVGTTAGTGSCQTYTRSNTTWGFTTSSFTFTASTTGDLVLSIEPVSSYYSGGTCVSCQNTYGMIVDNVSIVPQNPTPVTLSDFKAIKNGSRVDLNWQTAMEINNDYFTLEKSKNGIGFTAIGIVDGAGNSQNTLNYQTTDPSPYNGTSYYRLKQTDLDGTVSCSKIIAVNVNADENISIYPNPGTGIFWIQGLGKESEITVHNTLGETILIKRIFSDSSEIDLSSESSGVYYIKVNNGDTSTSTKIILNR